MGWKGDPNAIHDDVSGEINALTEKSSPASGDWVMIEDSAASNVKKKAQVGNIGGGGGDIPGWVSYLKSRQAGETAHTDDDFFDDGTPGGTAVNITGTATWTEKYDVLSVVFSGQNASDVEGRLYTITSASAPMTIETAVRKFGPSSSNFMSTGLIFADGTSTSSNCVAIRLLEDLRVFKCAGTLTNYTSSVNANVTPTVQGPLLHMRLVWTAANSWDATFSADGISWTDSNLGSWSHTMTPTRFGLFVSAQGEPLVGTSTFEYFRVYDSDLS